MTYVVTAACIDVNDRSCIEVCPVECIHPVGRMLVIDPDTCIDCGACEPACPVEAIYVDTALPPADEPFAEIGRVLVEDVDRARELIDAYIATHELPAVPGRSSDS